MSNQSTQPATTDGAKRSNFAQLTDGDVIFYILSTYLVVPFHSLFLLLPFLILLSLCSSYRNSLPMLILLSRRPFFSPQHAGFTREFLFSPGPNFQSEASGLCYGNGHNMLLHFRHAIGLDTIEGGILPLEDVWSTISFCLHLHRNAGNCNGVSRIEYGRNWNRFEVGDSHKPRRDGRVLDSWRVFYLSLKDGMKRRWRWRWLGLIELLGARNCFYLSNRMHILIKLLHELLKMGTR